MSHKQNEEWLEAAKENFLIALEEDNKENFLIALEEDNVELAKAIIADTFDAGFDRDARKMNIHLREIALI